MSIVTFKRGDKTALTKNFTRDEFQCQCKKCEAQMIDTELVEKLQRIRDVLGVPLKITSGYRCIVHNASKTVGGSRTSKHLYGFAADWRTLNRTLNPVALGIIAQAVGFGGIGIYWHPEAAMCHADTRAGKATWLCTSPGVYPSTTYNAFILPTIRRGCTGDANRAATKMLQRLLKLTPDGLFGEATENALLRAQESYGLKVDGICGPTSWKVISGASKYLL